YARNHDASFCSAYGGEHTVDVHAIFPDFDKNPYDPESYDFTLTDGYLQMIVDAGTEVFYRLGTKIEHWVKKYGTIPPKDPKKWAIICEHIIRHYTEGWADGKHFKITYWEIWNEPDLPQNWAGTPEQYFELYVTAATHLKKCFPHLKIGGPALSSPSMMEWAEDFMKYLNAQPERVPLDFFSWHLYRCNIGVMLEKNKIIEEFLEKFGYGDVEIILNEWNYLENWTDMFTISREHIHGMRGAAYSAALMCAMQKTGLDMLMYYDAQPSGWNGLFDSITYAPLKGYYPFLSFSELYKLKNEVASSSDDEAIHVAAATDGEKKAAMITHYTHDKNATPKEIEIDFPAGDESWYCYKLDKDYTMYRTEFAPGKIKINPDTMLLITNYKM
ncbi:MAG: hypothetical protein IKW02_03740, partial [Clostridia bacterium]|nr:hypothetical protein [Clostridia bacterium]